MTKFTFLTKDIQVEQHMQRGGYACRKSKALEHTEADQILSPAAA